jgi:hypothetical protein
MATPPQYEVARDRVNVRTPMRCPLCGGQLSDVLIRDIGGVTASIIWQVHAGRCGEHGWFQTEIVSRPTSAARRSIRCKLTTGKRSSPPNRQVPSPKPYNP